MITKKVAAVIIKNKSGEYLLQKKTMDYPVFPGKWTIFGGEIEGGENPKETLKRELKEETGIEFENLKFLGKNTWKNKNYELYEDIFGVIFLGEMQDIRLSEGAGFAFFSKEELKSLDIFEESLKIINRYGKLINFKNS